MCTRLCVIHATLLMTNNYDDDEEEVREEDGREAYEFLFYAAKTSVRETCRGENRR